MENRLQLKAQLDLITSDTCIAVLDILRPEMGHSECWPNFEHTIKGALGRVLEDGCNTIERYQYALTLILNISEARLGNEPAWPVVRRNLLHVLSPSRGAGFAIRKLLEGVE